MNEVDLRTGSMREALIAAEEAVDATFNERLLVRLVLIRPYKRLQLARALTERLTEAGVISVEACDSDGVYAGNWLTDVLDWLIEHWDEVLEIILAIISLF